jgi:hypothetical protein
MKVRAVYPIYPPLRYDSEIYVEIYRRLIEYLSTEREICIRGDTSHDGEKLFVQVKKFTKTDEKHLNKKSPWKIYWMLEFSGSFKFPGSKKYSMKDHTGKVIPTPARELRSHWVSFLPIELDLTIQTYLLALTISFPGAMRPTDNVWWVGGKRHYYSKYYKSSTHEALEFLYEEKFKPREDIKPDDVIDWIFKSNGMFNGFSDTPASRSLNFLTRLFVEDYREDELSDLVWAVAGIEALLVEGGRSSIGQLRDKLTAIFQDRVEFVWLNKSITDLYNFRSRMIHGDRQIKSVFRANEDEVNSRFYEEYHSQLFAIGILVVLLREVIARKTRKIQFMTVVKEA